MFRISVSVIFPLSRHSGHFANYIRERAQCFAAVRAETLLQNELGIGEVLEKIFLVALEPLAYFLKVLRAVQLAHNGRAELKIGLSTHEQAHALIYRLHIEFSSPTVSAYFSGEFLISIAT